MGCHRGFCVPSEAKRHISFLLRPMPFPHQNRIVMILSVNKVVMGTAHTDNREEKSSCPHPNPITGSGLATQDCVSTRVSIMTAVSCSWKLFGESIKQSHCDGKWTNNVWKIYPWRRSIQLSWFHLELWDWQNNENPLQKGVGALYMLVHPTAGSSDNSTGHCRRDLFETFSFFLKCLFAPKVNKCQQTNSWVQKTTNFADKICSMSSGQIIEHWSLKETGVSGVSVWRRSLDRQVSPAWDATCSALMGLQAFAISGDFLSIFAITIDRFLTINFPLRYEALLTRGRVHAALVSILLFSLMFSALLASLPLRYS